MEGVVDDHSSHAAIRRSRRLIQRVDHAGGSDEEMQFR